MAFFVWICFNWLFVSCLFCLCLCKLNNLLLSFRMEVLPLIHVCTFQSTCQDDPLRPHNNFTKRWKVHCQFNFTHKKVESTSSQWFHKKGGKYVVTMISQKKVESMEQLGIFVKYVADVAATKFWWIERNAQKVLQIKLGCTNLC